MHLAGGPRPDVVHPVVLMRPPSFSNNASVATFLEYYLGPLSADILGRIELRSMILFDTWTVAASVSTAALAPQAHHQLAPFSPPQLRFLEHFMAHKCGVVSDLSSRATQSGWLHLRSTKFMLCERGSFRNVKSDRRRYRVNAMSRQLDALDTTQRCVEFSVCDRPPALVIRDADASPRFPNSSPDMY